ncbi:phosphatase PAP2 family protein [Paraglaciecola agarilytica]|uniref:phosphatase PAP2 family protein n=1 Tax=Paraglaciecola chathamensis TaxID=368405 RepID=UPI001C096FCB|nr:phosphatase PAP2 family protein [Paraglaciecola agarilytica]MBU3016858.1 phosphatase PAP2 family protein [Paraglaciecola agarilytica]
MAYILKDSKQIGLFILLSIACWLFIELAGVVIADKTMQIDEQLVLLFREPFDLSDPIGPKWVEELMRDITALGGVGILVMVTLIATTFLLLSGQKKAALLVLLGIATGMVLSFSLKYGFSRPRPDLVPHGSYVYTSSFPSGHAMMSSLVYFTVGEMLAQQQSKRKLKTFFYSVAAVFTISIGLSRVYLGVHYPTDVLAGWLVGCSWALLIYFIYRGIKLRRNRIKL